MGKTHRKFIPYANTSRDAYVRDQIMHTYLHDREYADQELKWRARPVLFRLCRTREEVEAADAERHATDYDRMWRDGYTSHLTWKRQFSRTTSKARRADDKRRISKIRLDPDFYDEDAWGGFRNGKPIFWDYW